MDLTEISEGADDSRKFDDDLKPARTGTWLNATAHVVTAVIGSGVLGLPWSIAQLGWVVGSIMLIFFAWATFYTSALLADCYRHHVTGRRNYTYMDAVNSHLGKKQVYLCAIAQYLNLLCTSIGYTVTSATSMVAVKRAICFHRNGHEAHCHVSNIPWMILFGGIQIFLSQLPDFSHLKFVSIVAAVMSAIYSFIGLGLSVARVSINKHAKGPVWGTQLSAAQKTWSVFQALGNIAFAYSFCMVLIEIQDTVRGPPKYAMENVTMKKATIWGISITTAFYTTVGCLGFAAFGIHAPGNILTGFGFYNPYWILAIGNICVVIHLVGAYQVYVQPIFAALERVVHNNWPRKNLIGFRLITRTLFVIAVTLVASALPFFNDINGFIGAISFFPLTVYFPTAMYIKSKGKALTSTKELTMIWALRIISGLITLVAIIGSVEGIRSSVQGTKLFHTKN
ncbi:amino acid permease [Marchantia polymorpha subsp. ruderalis]|nr:hypothetical protein MARPO_0170s0014 [Marchantia polymorpha]BBN15057.1 hypothetical protein Mp_6g16630 [Marchantia polymorpha subsp. ruderalis]|eukprot:PTQ28210.1 hypothetical protein MARPO_0170s0014 [Marchantia polymorpha]